MKSTDQKVIELHNRVKRGSKKKFSTILCMIPLIIFGGIWFVIFYYSLRHNSPNSPAIVVWLPTTIYAATLGSGVILNINTWNKSCSHALMLLIIYFVIWLILGFIIGFNFWMIVAGSAVVFFGSFIHTFIQEMRHGQRSDTKKISSLQ